MHDTLKALRALQARFHIRDDLPFEEWRGIIEAASGLHIKDTDTPIETLEALDAA